MFDFEKLTAYQLIKTLNVRVLTFLNKTAGVDLILVDQWKRASLSVLLNLAEGSGRVSRNDKRHFYTIARGSLFECVAVLDLMKEMNLIDVIHYKEIYQGYEESSKMLLALYRSCK